MAVLENSPLDLFLLHDQHLILDGVSDATLQSFDGSYFVSKLLILTTEDR